jgi:nucleotide-binding universal stress UspA family protein
MKASAKETVTNQLPSIRRVLVAVDLSDHSEATALHAAKIAKCFDARLMIVHVYEPVPLCEYASETTFTVWKKSVKIYKSYSTNSPGRFRQRV